MLEVLIPAKLSEAKTTALKVYLKRRVLELKQGNKELYESKIIKWRAAYEARPREEVRQFPFQNASNIIVPIIAIHTDTLHAQIMAAIFKTHPIVVAKILGEQGENATELKDAYEEYMQYVCIEPSELDLYRVYDEGYRECIKYGTVTFKCPWEEKLRDFLIPGGDGTGSSKDFMSRPIYQGPRPEKLPFNSFYLPPQSKTLESADIKCHKRTMMRYELEERKFTDVYLRSEVDEILKVPDRTSPDEVIKQEQQQLGAKTSSSFGHQEWDIWECYISWRYEDEAFAPRMIVTYHEKSDRILRVMWDNYESEWFVGARMSERDDMYYGYGFAETLWSFQEGASETYNGYRDNMTVANTRVWRVNTDSKLHQGYRIYPSAMVPGDKDEIEPMAHGELSQVNIEELRMLLDLSERRSGVTPPQQGYGAGTVGKKGVYSAMGTLAVMQEGNSRKDLNVSDMRDAHVRLMRLVSNQYARFGENKPLHKRRLELFGKKAELIAQAFKRILDGSLGLPVYSSTASVNREVEKQNDILLTQIANRHYQMVAQLLGMLYQQQVPPVVKEYGVEIIRASNFLMKNVFRNFGFDEVERLVPDPLKNVAAQAQKQPQPGQQPLAQGAQPNASDAANPRGAISMPSAPSVSGGEAIQ
jgi:hypothetical protein